MDWTSVLGDIDAALAGDLDRAEKAVRVAALLRQAGGYRWVGLYAVTDHEIAAVGWSGPGEPAHPRFPVTQGAQRGGRRQQTCRGRGRRDR